VDEKCAKVFVGNKLEILANQLYENLFQSQGSIFNRKIVIVAYPFQKRFLQHFFAKKSIYSGVKFYSLNSALQGGLFRTFNLKEKKIPSALDLQITLFCKMQELSTSKEEIYKPLLTYLENDPERLVSLSLSLRNVFLRYGSYADSLEEWKEKKGWKQALWNLVFEKWTYPLEKLKNLTPKEGEIHLFGFVYLPKTHLEFFKHQEACFYTLSPCAHYWGDLCSDKERRHIHKSLKKEYDRERLDLYIRDTNPLLANLGKLGRSFLNLMQDLDFIFEELYESDTPQTLLQYVQQDLLDLKNPEASPKTYIKKDDDSIHLHIASSKLQEVEILRDHILAMGLLPEDILVIAQDISSYAPFIHNVFGNTGIEYAIFDENAFSKSSFIAGFKKLLMLPKRRFDVDGIIELFSSSSFLEKWDITLEDKLLFSKWIRSSKVRFGKDLKQKQALLDSSEVEAIGTWEYGFKRLLTALASDSESISIDLSESEKLGKLISMMQLLFSKLEPLEKGVFKSLEDWSLCLKEIADTFFVIDEEGTFFFKKLPSFSIEKDPVPYLFVEKILNDLFTSAKTPYNRANLHAMPCCSLKIAGAFYAKAIFLLGMKEGAFPRIEIPSSLSLLKLSLNPADEERYLFLLLLTQASKSFIMSFVREEKENPSFVIQELFSYINSSYVLEKSLVTEHAAKALLAKEAACFFPDFYADFPLPLREKEKEIVIDIKHLNLLAKHPLRFYFNVVLKMYLESESNFHEGEFVLSDIDKADFRKGSLKQDFSALFEKALRQGSLPHGAFKEVAKCKASDEVEDYQKNLASLSLSLDKLFNVELKMMCDTQDILNGRSRILPPLKVPLKEGRTAYIIGMLENIVPEGLLFHKNKSLPDLIEAFPSFLVYLNLNLGSPSLLLTKKGQTYKMEADPLKSLVSFVEYYEACLEAPSPLMPTWSAALLQKGSKELQKAFEASDNDFSLGFEDVYLKWLFSKDPLFSSDYIFEKWASYAKELFAPLIEED